MKLMEDKFLVVLAAVQKLKIVHFVIFPWGMGAFLRPLKRNDSHYDDETGRSRAMTCVP